MPHPRSLAQKIIDAHKTGGALKASVTLKTTGRKPNGFDYGHAIPGETVKVPKEMPLTQGAFGALAYHVAKAVETAPHALINFDGILPKGVNATDLALHAAIVLPRKTENGEPALWLVELAGLVMSKLTMEERMVLCAKLSTAPHIAACLIAPDEATFKALGIKEKDQAELRLLKSDEPREDLEEEHQPFAFTRTVETPRLAPYATWTPEVISGSYIRATLDTSRFEDADETTKAAWALPEDGQAMTSMPIDYVFIGPFEDYELDELESAVEVFRGRKVASGMNVYIFPGSDVVKKTAEDKGWDKTFTHSGCLWNPSKTDIEYPAEKGAKRCAQTLPLLAEKAPSPRTHYMSAQMAATAAICGRIADVRDFI